MSRARFVLLAILFASPLYSAEKTRPCTHLAQGSFQQVYTHSPFAHGLRHGYEAGFHDADLDYHLGYDEREVKLDKVPGTQGFQKRFGDKKSFRRGYEYGYMAGYRDSFAGRKFHYPPATDAVAAELVNQRYFDTGLADGFRRTMDSNSGQSTCSNDQPGYCEGFRLGVKLASEERHAHRMSVASK
jgi:hypothetical protein